MYKILITGPESTGKSSLVESLAKYFKAVYVSEFSRAYIDQLKRAYDENDLLLIAKGQLRDEDEISAKGHPILFVDTDLTVMDIWSQEKYGRTHPWILEQMQKRIYDLYLMPDIDLDWTYDAQRENPEDRGRLLKIYQDSFAQRNITYHMIRGQGEERVQQAVKIVEWFLRNAKC